MVARYPLMVTSRRAPDRPLRPVSRHIRLLQSSITSRKQQRHSRLPRGRRDLPGTLFFLKKTCFLSFCTWYPSFVRSWQRRSNVLSRKSSFVSSNSSFRLRGQAKNVSLIVQYRYNIISNDRVSSFFCLKKLAKQIQDPSPRDKTIMKTRGKSDDNRQCNTTMLYKSTQT